MSDCCTSEFTRHRRTMALTHTLARWLRRMRIGRHLNRRSQGSAPIDEIVDTGAKAEPIVAFWRV